MQKAWAYLLCLLCAGSLLASVFWFAIPQTPAQGAVSQAAAPYTLKDCGGRLALYRAGQSQPVQIYEIYTHLLPEQDAAQLQRGIGLQTEAQLERLLEDFGA